MNMNLNDPSENNPQGHEPEADKTHQPHEFPMIVWLRGDEPYFHEFSLDAEKVMEYLNIKRSRLTQISGKDLRVGRTRIDRYIRPVYRLSDIEDYLQWTRPTASHKKSSKVLEDAAEKLSRENDLLLKQIVKNWDSFSQNIDQGTDVIRKKMGDDQKRQLHLHFSTQKIDLQNKSTQNALDDLAVHCENIPLLQDGLTNMLSILQYIQTTLTKIQIEQQNLFTQTEKQEKAQHQHWDALEQWQEQFEQQQQQDLSLQALSGTPPRPHRRVCIRQLIKQSHLHSSSHQKPVALPRRLRKGRLL